MLTSTEWKILKTIESTNDGTIHIANIFERGFQYWKIFSFRFEYSLNDYRYEQINIKYSNIKRTILLIIQAWLAIISQSILIICSNSPYLIDFKYINEILDVQRLDYVLIQTIIMFILLEYMWFEMFKKIINYHSYFTNFLLLNSTFNEQQQIQQKYRQYLIDFFRKTNQIAIYSCKISLFSLTNMVIACIYFACYLYFIGKIDKIQLIITIPIYLIYARHIIFILCQLFVSINFLVFLIEYLIIRFRQLCQLSKELEIRNRIFFWKQFHYKYIKLYHETYQLNGTVQTVLFIIGIISKSAAIIALIFYSRQEKIGIHNTLAIINLAFISIYSNILFIRVSRMPTLNQQCTKSLTKWLARKQFCLNEIPFKFKRLLLWQQIIKKNLFIETMIENGFGFTCGQIFLVTKYEFVKLILMDIPFFTLFYKKICMK